MAAVTLLAGGLCSTSTMATRADLETWRSMRSRIIYLKAKDTGGYVGISRVPCSYHREVS